MALGMVSWPTVDSARSLHIDYSDSGTNVAMENLFPMNVTRQKDSEVIRYDILGHVTGMTAGSYLGNKAKLIAAPKLEEHMLRPTYWKDAAEIGEKDIIRLRSIQSGKDRQRSALEQWYIRRWQLNTRMSRRLEWTCWQALENAWAGGVTIDDQYIKIDYGLAAETPFLGGALWTAYTTSDPVKDFQDELVSWRGKGVHYVDVYMNKVTANHMCRSDKLREQFAGTPLFYSLAPGNLNEEVLKIIDGGNPGQNTVRLRKFVINDGTYQDASDTTQLYIPDGRVHIIGGRNDAKRESLDSPFSTPESLFGEWLSTPAIQGMAKGGGDLADVGAGPFFITDTSEIMDDPPRVSLRCGINGAPAIYHRNWCKRWQVT